MKPDFQIIHGDCRTELAKLPEKSVHMCVTSPPYWGLRKYEGVEPSVWGDGDELCAQPSQCGHQWREDRFCDRLCGAWKGLLGLEPTIDQFVRNIVECFRAVRRVLRDDGCCFINCGDSYIGGNNKASGGSPEMIAKFSARGTDERKPTRIEGIPPKNLIGQPWRIAFALQADGWYLRSDIIWHKPNPMPESVSDRPTRAHEYLFLLTLKPRYFYDAEAVRESNSPTSHTGGAYKNEWKYTQIGHGGSTSGMRVGVPIPHNGRNKRSVWTIPTEANPEAHFASFPRKLVLPCVLAGTSEKGCCPECGTPWVRVVERDRQPTRPGTNTKYAGTSGDQSGAAGQDLYRHVTDVKTVGWCPGLDQCVEHPHPIPCTVLDPFAGSGTAGIVATQQGRKFIGIDASAEYCEMARRRIANPEPEAETPDAEGQMTFEELAT